MGCDCCPCKRTKKKKKKDKQNEAFIPVPSLSVVTLPAGKDSAEKLGISQDEIEAHYKDMKNIFAYAVGAMTNFLGAPCYPFITQPRQLYPYILFLCEGLDPEDYSSIKENISKQKLADIQLSVLIKDAKLIHPKVTEFSQIFCKLWIDKEDEKHTSVKEGTTYVLWDEPFVLDVADYESGVIHVEVWSTRPETGLFERMTSHDYDKLKEDDPLAEEKGMYFIGDAFEYVKALPCVGQNHFWTLKKGPRRAYTKGQLNIHLRVGVEKNPDVFLLHLHCHITFIRLAYEKQVLAEEESGHIWKNWLEILPNEAITLIQQHAIQTGLTPTEQTLCSWIVLSALKMKHEDRISFEFLRDVLELLLRNVNELELQDLKDHLAKSISEFSSFTLDMLRNLHKNFDVHNSETADELFYMLRCMSLTELEMCSNYMDSYQKIEEESSEWYLKVIRDSKREFQDDESVLSVCEGLKNILKKYVQNQIVFDDIFMRAWNVQYSHMTYKPLDKVVCFTIQPMIQHVTVLIDDPQRTSKVSESILMLQLYHAVRNLVNYIIKTIPSQRTLICMDEYSTWFGEEMVLEWFLLCDLYTSPFIQRAVLADTMQRINPLIVHGTSVPDVAAIIEEMVLDIWMKLHWKDQFYSHGALIEATKSCIVYYSKSILQRLEMEKFFCPVGEFKVKEKLCVALSNMYAMSEHLLTLTKKIKTELKVAETALGFELSGPLLDVLSEMQVMVAKMYLLVYSKIGRRINKIVSKAVRNPDSNNPEELAYYMDNTLEVMYRNLKHEAFYVNLRHMWVVLLKNLKYGLNYKKKCLIITRKRRLNVYMVILQSLQIMKNVFFCDGHGLTPFEMENNLYVELKYGIEERLG